MAGITLAIFSIKTAILLHRYRDIPCYFPACPFCKMMLFLLINKYKNHRAMNKTKTRALKIKIDSQSLSASDLKEIEQWENEGGRAVPDKSSPWKNAVPLRKGQIFEVVSDDLIYEDDTLYYIAEVELLALS